jgi:hypothetical protein
MVKYIKKLIRKCINAVVYIADLSRVAHQTHNEISYLCDLYGSDKGSMYGSGAYYPWLAHTYTPVYERLFAPIRHTVEAVFECGLGTNSPNFSANMGALGQPGASHRVWRDYFPQAIIVGADIDKEVLFEEERIHTGFIDQTSPVAIAQFFNSLAPKFPAQFDIMIDDGLHTFEAAICLFENSFSQLKAHGIYVIEDMSLNDIPRFKDYFQHLPNAKHLTVNYMLMPMGTINSPLYKDNNLIIIRKNP